MRFAKTFRLRGCLLAWALAAHPLPAADAPSPGGAPLTRVAEIRRLSRETAAKGLPVSVRGVCMWVGGGDFFLHDGGEGIWVSGFNQRVNGLAPRAWEKGAMEVGAELELKGVTSSGGYAPSIFLREARRVGTRELPPARRLPIDLLMAGNADAQRVEVEGVVQEVGTPWGRGMRRGIRVTMMVDGHTCSVGIDVDLATAARWVDARVRVRGVGTPDFNFRSQAVRAKILVNGPQDVEVLSPAPEDPFSAPRVALRALMHYSPDAEPSRRKVTEGTVVFAVPGSFLFLQDGPTGVRVATRSREVAVGQRVAVAGFLDRHLNFAGLTNATIRPLGTAPVPAPEPATARQLLDGESRSSMRKATASDLNARAVRLPGWLRRVDWLRPGVPETAWVEADGRTFGARFPLGQALDPAAARRWLPGAEVSVAGICELEFHDEPDEYGDYPPVSFHLWLAAPDDLRIVKLPPWWTPQRLLTALGSIAAALLLALAWAAALRLRVAQRSTELAGEIRARSEAAGAFAATLRERQRLAADLHDTLEQALTALALQLKAVEKFQPTDPARGAQHLHLARQFLARSREDVRRSVWNLRAQGLEGRSLDEALKDLELLSASKPEMELRVSTHGDPFPVPDFIGSQLLLLAQEAVTNALKHGAPQHIDLRLGFSPEALELTIEDDGGGFDPAASPGPDEGHFGLLGMRERLKRLGGTLDLHSAPAQPTRITARIPAAKVASLTGEMEPATP